MRRTLTATLLLACCALAAAPVYSQYPSKPVRIVVGFAAGGPVDSWARTVAEALSDQLRNPVIVENRPGAGGLLAAEATRQAAPDGHTLLLGGFSTLVVAPLAEKNMPFDPVADFSPISLLGRGTFAMFASPVLPARSLAEFVDHARANPGKLNYATAAAIDSFLSARLVQVAGITMTRVQYKGAAQLIPDLIAGRVHSVIMPLAAGQAHVKDGRLRALAAFGSRRSAMAPEVPTAAEAGFAQVSSPNWTGFFGPARVPGEIAERLSREMSVLVKRPEVLERFERQAFELEASSAQELGSMLNRDYELWKKVVAEGIL